VADKTRTSRSALRGVALLGGTVLLASCGTSAWAPSEGATLVTAPPEPPGAVTAPSAWGGELTVREGCVVVVEDPDPVRVAVLPAGWTLVEHAETGDYAVQSDTGETFPLGTKYWGGGVAIESAADLARYPETTECANKLGTDRGTLIYTVEPESSQRETAPGAAPTS
jgi:hypothetical protein